MNLRSFMIGFGLTIGIIMLIWWSIAISTGSVPEFEEEPFGISLHIGAEVVTAIMLISSSVLMIKRISIARGMFNISLGMLIYTSIASSGYFLDRSEIIPLMMFAIILLVSIILMVLSFRSRYHDDN